MTVYCNLCGHEMNVSDMQANQTVRCNACGCEFTASQSMTDQFSYTEENWEMPPSPEPEKQPEKTIRAEQTQRAERTDRGKLSDNGNDPEHEWDAYKNRECLPGEIIVGRYEIQTELGRGRMGIVYRCMDKVTGQVIALKALPADKVFKETEMPEVRNNFLLVNNLRHPNIATYTDLVCDPETQDYYLIMDYVEGEDLRNWILRNKGANGKMSLEQIMPVIHEIAEALDFTHRQKIIHRDIKPENIMLDKSGSVKILDFGIAAPIDPDTNSALLQDDKRKSITGPYMPPEQWCGRKLYASSDQYSLAVMTFEMLTGHLPFDHIMAIAGYPVYEMSLGTLSRNVIHSAPLRQEFLQREAQKTPELPSHVWNVFFRALHKDPHVRFATCSDFVSALSGK